MGKVEYPERYPETLWLYGGEEIKARTTKFASLRGTKQSQQNNKDCFVPRNDDP